MHLTDLLNGLTTDPITAGTDALITGIEVDSRRIHAGNLFVSLPGTAYDGRKFIAEAIAAGAIAILTDNRPLDSDIASIAADAGVPLLIADNPRHSMAIAAARYWSSQPGMIAAVTGTNGKTSTAEFLRQLWQRATWQAIAVGTLGITGTEAVTIDGKLLDLPSLTTPDSLSLHAALSPLSKAGITHLALEASSHGLEQHRLDGLNIHVAGFTNLSRDHLDHHNDMDEYFAAKLRLFTALLKEGGGAVINLDDAYASSIIDSLKHRAIVIKTFGFSKEADFQIQSITPVGDGLDMKVIYQDHLWHIPLALSGTFQALNALAAAVMAHVSGLPLHDSLGALPYLHAAPGRMQTVHGHPSGARVVVDYAHTPDALDAALGALRPEATGKLVVLFGCGGDRDPGKRKLMGEVASKSADRVIITDDNPRTEDAASIRAAIIAGCKTAEEIIPRDTAIAAALQDLAAGDVLLIAGKGHEAIQLMGTETLPFDDASVASNFIHTMQRGT